MAKNLKVNIDSEEFRNSFRPHMPPSRASTEEPIQKEAPKNEVEEGIYVVPLRALAD